MNLFASRRLLKITDSLDVRAIQEEEVMIEKDMRDKFPKDFDKVTDISYNPTTGRIDLMKDDNQDKNDEENKGGFFGLFSNPDEVSSDKKTSKDTSSGNSPIAKPVVVKSEEQKADEAALEALKSDVEKLDDQFRASKRKISALNLDIENKDRKIRELDEKQKEMLAEIESLKSAKN